MPCRSDYMEPTPAELGRANQVAIDKIKAELDRLTAENDQLREIILRLDDGGSLTDAEAAQVGREQVEHRKADLARLARTFVKTKDAARLQKVWSADPLKPLTSQLGFDPDDY